MRGWMAAVSVAPAAVLVWAALGAASPAAAAPDFAFRGAVVYDSAALGGDNDRAAEPGETFDLAIRLANEGDVAAQAITASLVSINPGVTVSGTPATVAFPDAAPGAIATSIAPHFRLTASAALPCGSVAPLDLELSYQDAGGTGIRATLRIVLFLGKATAIVADDFDQGAGGWYQDDAASNPVEPPNRAGRWVNATPEFYLWATVPAQPGRDATPGDTSCMYTGQNLDPLDPSTENVDGGSQVLRSSLIDLSGRSNVGVSYARWFFSDDPAGSDLWVFQVSNDGGAMWRNLETLSASANRWDYSGVLLDALAPALPLTATMLFRVAVVDQATASVAEGAFDDFRIDSYACAVDPPEARLASGDPVIDDTVDPGCTDRDGIADDEETFDFSVTVTNTGTAAANNATATLRAPLPAALTLVGPATVNLGTVADNGGTTVATWRLQVRAGTACRTPAVLNVDLAGDPTTIGQPGSYPLTLEEDVNQPLQRWYDDFDSGLPAWSVVTYGVNNFWASSQENCVQNPGPPPTPARTFWYTGFTGTPTDCQVNPYGPNNDSAVRTPRIDLTYARPGLRALKWNQLLTLPPGDPDQAEVWIDHDDDGTFSLLQSYQGQVTSNGDTLDPASIDLSGLTGVATHVQLEFRFLSDTTGGGGTPLSLGWMIDNVELSWVDLDGRRCDANTCGSNPCSVTPSLSASRPQACVGQSILLDASASTLTNCPSGGTAVYAWSRDGAPLPDTTATLLVQEPLAGTHTYRVDVSCSTQPSCTAPASQVVEFITCAGCVALATLAPAPNRACAGTGVDLDGSGSSVINCPAGIAYAWYREPDPTVLGTGPTYRASETVPGSYSFRLDVSCASDPTCIDSRRQPIEFLPDGLPLAVGNTLRARRRGSDVDLYWTDAQPLASSWRIERAQVKGSPGTPSPVPASPWTDAGAVTPPPAHYLYVVRAVSCTGQVGP